MSELRFRYETIRQMPPLVRTACFNYDGWVVGGAANFMLGQAAGVKDWDVIVPVYHWMDVCRIIPYGTRSNTFGGFKLAQDGAAIGIWADDVGHYFLTATKGGHLLAVSPKSQRFAVYGAKSDE